MLFDDNNFDYNFFNLANFNLTDPILTMNDDKLVSSKEGFLRGNMFKNEYKPYKSLTYVDIRPQSDREAKLFNVMQFSFAINDLNLYLDLHPDDTRVVRLFEELVKEEKQAKKEYMEKYGPLTVTKVKGDKFDWIESPWPWDDLGGNMYV